MMRRLIAGSKPDEYNRKIDGGRRDPDEGGGRNEKIAQFARYTVFPRIYGNIDCFANQINS